MLGTSITTAIAPLVLAGWLAVTSFIPIPSNKNITIEEHNNKSITIYDNSIKDSHITVHVDINGKVTGEDVEDNTGLAGWDITEQDHEELHKELHDFVRPDQKERLEYWEKAAVEYQAKKAERMKELRKMFFDMLEPVFPDTQK